MDKQQSLSEEVARLAERAALGNLEQVYGTNPEANFMVGSVLLVLLAGLLAWLVPHTSPSWRFGIDSLFSNLDALLLTGIVLVGLLIASYLWVVFLRRHVAVYLFAEGLAYRTRREINVIRWEQIAEVEHPLRQEKQVKHTTKPYPSTLPGYYSEKEETVINETGFCALRLNDGQRIEFDTMIDNHFLLSWAIEDQRKQKKRTEASEPILTALHDPESQVRLQAVKDLTYSGGARTIDSLITALHDPDSKVRGLAAKALGHQGDARAIDPLAAALRDSDSTVRESAAQALGYYSLAYRSTALHHREDTRIVEPLIEALRDPASEVRAAAADAFSLIKDARAVEPLLAVLHDRVMAVQVAAAGALANLGDGRAVAPLLAAFRDPDRTVRQSATETLIRIKNARVVESLVESLIEYLQDPNSKMRRRAAETLGEMREARAVEPLMAALRDPDSGVRSEAANAFNFLRLKDRRAVEPLIATLRDPDSKVRVSAIRALSSLGDKRAAQPLEMLARQDSDSNVRESARAALRTTWT